MRFLDPPLLAPLFDGRADTLIAACYANERPLQGLAGLIDWQFSGALTRFLRAGAIRGEPGECVLVPLRHGQHTVQILLVGVGTNDRPGERLDLPKKSLENLKKNLAHWKGRTVALHPQDLGTSTWAQWQKILPGVTLCPIQPEIESLSG